MSTKRFLLYFTLTVIFAAILKAAVAISLQGGLGYSVREIVATISGGILAILLAKYLEY